MTQKHLNRPPLCRSCCIVALSTFVMIMVTIWQANRYLNHCESNPAGWNHRNIVFFLGSMYYLHVLHKMQIYIHLRKQKKTQNERALISKIKIIRRKKCIILLFQSLYNR